MPAKNGKFVVYLDKQKKFRFRLLAANGEIIAAGEAYESKAACLKGIASIQKNAPTAETVDETVKKEPAKEAAEKKPRSKKADEPVKETVEKKTRRKKAATEE
jgi:uncharacterized protein YegP (UPF0339 family)